jgi:hypothetical protein
LSTVFRAPALVSGCLVTLLAAASGCQKDPAAEGGQNGGTGTGGTTATGGSSGGAGAATGGAGPTGGAATGGAATGGAAGASGSGTTGGTAGASGAGGGGDACARAIFCDDFDDPAPNMPPATPWTVQRGGAGTAVVDATHHMSGTQSVKFVVPGQSDSAYIALRNAPIFPVTGNAFYGRVMLWLAAAPTASVHWTLIEGSGLVPGQTYHAAYRLGGQHPITAGNQLMANYETPDSYSGNGPQSDCWHHADGVVVPVGRWSCFEWQYGGPNNAITLWVDGTQALAVRGMGEPGRGDGCGGGQPATFPWTAPTFDTLRVGWDSYQADGERTLWLDDVAISAERVGCPSGTGQ